MNSLEIYKELKHYKEFLGVYSRDKLNFYMPDETGIIINTDKSGEPGEHWVAIYKNERTIYFDSFGLPPIQDEIIDYLNKINPIGWFHNTICFQSYYQDTCGMYSMIFLACMFEFRSFDKFIEIFNLNKHSNDILAKIIYKFKVIGK